MIPFFEQPVIRLGPLSIHAFGVIVAISVLIGFKVSERRFDNLDLDRTLGERMNWWLLVGGFLGAHIFAVLFYFPEKIVRDPFVLLRVWDDISSFGGIFGGIIGIWLFFHFRARIVDGLTRVRYLDVSAYAFTIALMVGRIGCALAHDHPGRVTSFPLAVSLDRLEAQQYVRTIYARANREAELPPSRELADLGFHDLGLYEFLYLLVVVVPIVVLAGKRKRPPAFFLALFTALYMPVRFALDFLRVSDARYAGFTPAQWLAVASMLALGGILLRRGLVRSSANLER